MLLNFLFENMVGVRMGDDAKSEANFELDDSTSCAFFDEPVGVVGEKSCDERVLRFKVLLIDSIDVVVFCALMASWFRFTKLEEDMFI